MKKRGLSSRIMSVLLSLMMLLSLLPTAVLADESATKTYTKVTSADELVTGEYVMVANNGYAPGVLDGSWVTAVAVTAANDQVIDPTGGVWTLTVGKNGTILSDANGKAIAPKGGNNNGIKSGSYQWAVDFDATDGTFTFAGQGDDTVKLASNASSENKFRAYKNETITKTPGGYPCHFTLYKLGGGLEQVAAPTGTASGDVKVGDTVAFACKTADATLRYKVDDGAYQDYTGPVTITASCTITVKAVKDGMTDSQEVVFTYKAYRLVDKYVKTAALTGGDKVVIFNAGNGFAVSSTVMSNYYLTPVAATVEKDVLTANAMDALVWDVTANDDGTYTFTQNDKTLTLGENNGKFHLNMAANGTTRWDVETCNAENASYYLSGSGVTGQYGKVYLEYFAKFTEFSAYCTSTDRLKEADFGMTFYKLTQEKQYVDATPEPDPEEPATVPIRTALEGATDTEFTVKGVVTLVDGQNYYLQDATGAICLRLAAKTDEIALGDTIIGTGKRAEFRGMAQLGSGTFVKSSGLTLNAKPTTIAALTVDDVCTYVQLKGLEITEIYDNNGQYANPNVTFKDADGKTIQLYKAVLPKNGDSWAFAVGDKVDVTAAVGTNNGTLQLRNTVADEIRAAGSVNDPITDDMIPDGTLTVKEAGAITTKTENVSVVGQVVYHYGNAYNGAASINSIILEDVIGGEIYGFQVYDYANHANYKVGDVVKVTGTVSLYGGVPQMQSPAMEVVKAGVEAIPAQEITVSQMGADYLSEYVYIKDVTLGTYNASGSTPVTDATGSTKLFKGVPLPANTTEADVTALYACCSAYNGTYQLRNGASTDYVTNVTPPTPGKLPQAGDQVVIYNQNAEAVLAEQNDNTDSPAINKAAATIESGKAVCSNGAVVFTVERSGEYYRFRNDTYGYLCANGTGNNAFYSLTASEDADWLVRECSGNVGGYEMESRTAKYNGKYSQWLEYYSDSFKVYSMYSSTGDLDYTIYSFSFYPVAEGTELTGGIVNMPAVVIDHLYDAYVGQAYTFSFTVDAPFGVKGDMTATLAGEALTVTEEEGVYTVTIPVEKVTGDKLTVTISGVDNQGKAITRTVEIPVKDEPVFSDPKPMRGAQTGSDKRPAISVALANAGTEPTITMTVNGKTVDAVYADGRVTYTPAADLTDGRTEVVVTAKRTDGKEASFNWFFTVGKTQYQLYFGQLHSHTQYSDGSGTLTSALDYIKSIPASANVQFVAFTDHSNYFDSKTKANVEGALYDTSLVKDSDANHSWSTYKSTIDAFNAENAGSMVALGGFEMTWSGGPGHINTFNTPGVVSRNNTTLNNKTDDAGMKAYYALLSQAEGVDSISQFNHPGTTFGNFSDFSYWDPVIDSRMYMVEVGNGEGQIGAGGYYPSYEQYIMALDKGWHLAPTNNQDNHKGRWGNANDARDVILTDNFTEKGIYEAIRALRMYATEDKNLELGYTVNGQMMGSSITEVPEKLDLEVTVNDPDKSDSISKVEVVVNSGKVVHTWSDPAELNQGSLSVTLDPDYSYYFIRVTEGDGDLAVTSPVWVGESLKLGISNMVCGTATPVTDEELTLTTTLFNSEDTDATIKSLTYTIGGTVIGVDKGEGDKGYTLGKSSTLDVSFHYTPTAARVFTVQVTAVVEQNGKEYTFTKTIDLDVLNADALVYIGIDASHYNEYVAGNYKDSMGNFGNLAAKYSVRTVQLNSSEELIAACGNPKFKALILTAPSRRLEAAQADPKTYSADELAAIDAFNAAGGTVILAGWSDNYENYDVIQSNPAIKHMAATQNEVLAALGSSLRISDDATYDDVRSAADGVDKWRLYFSSYNMDNPLMDGVEVDPDHPYDKLYTERFSHYGGASIYAVDASGNATSTLPAAVSPVVYGHATTYSVDVDQDGLGGAGTPKYAFAENDSRLMVMATEQLEGRGMVVVSGAAFMSNFEVQASISDNGSEKNYSNYKICENLLQLINPVQITPIAEVQAQTEDGYKYTIEGVVTSNASGYDKETAFFDCIYVQDETGGINCFPVAGDFKIGDRVRVSGTTSSYQGEHQLAVTDIVKLGEGEAVTPREVTSTQVNDGSVLGQLITLKGYVVGIEMANGLVQTILVRDSAGVVSRVFIDGYICPNDEVKNLEPGCEISATGLASYDNTFVLADGTAMAPRIRISNRADIICTAHTHQFGEWVVTTPATCTEDGVETRTCPCGETETRVLPATGHTDADKDGKCDTCGAELEPVNPGKPDQPADPTKPATGDESRLVLWVSLMGITAVAGAALLVGKKRRG